jgi:acetone carboxylase gamma subunit
MTNFKGTKGKWKKSDELVMSEDNHKVVCISPSTFDLPTNNWKVNALLISKAPEMLEMLEELYNDSEAWSGLFPSQQLKIERLIKEATELS